MQIAGTTNNRGLKIAPKGRCLVIPRQLIYDATRVLKSSLQNDTANNAINALRSQGVLPEGVKVNHYLTDTDAWFIRTIISNGMNCFNRETISFAMDNDFDTSNAKAKSYERYSFGNSDFRSLFGSPGA